jgi:hypothetical protein
MAVKSLQLDVQHTLGLQKHYEYERFVNDLGKDKSKAAP